MGYRLDSARDAKPFAKVKFYHVVNKLWNTVIPSQWVMRSFNSTTDPRLFVKSNPALNDGLFYGDIFDRYPPRFAPKPDDVAPKPS